MEKCAYIDIVTNFSIQCVHRLTHYDKTLFGPGNQEVASYEYFNAMTMYNYGTHTITINYI